MTGSATELGFDTKVAIITGGGGGLGRAHALELARRGARVLVNDLGSSVSGADAGDGADADAGGGAGRLAAQRVVDEIGAAGGEAVANYDTVATAAGGRAIVAAALDAFGRVDIIVNNAGILRDTSFKNLTPELLDTVIDVHLRGAFHVTQPAWQRMRDQGYGRIINTSSAAGLFGNFGQANYGAAKMGLVGLTRVLAVEGARDNIKVNAIAPIARTRMTETILGQFSGQLGPELVTPVVVYLAHADCVATGEVFSVGGGRVARVFIGVTKGYAEVALTAEGVRDNLEQIRDEDGYVVPANLTEEMTLAFRAFA